MIAADTEPPADLPDLLAGRIFTHRLTAVEVSYDLVAVTPDLEPILFSIEVFPGAGGIPDNGALEVVFPLIGDYDAGGRRIPAVAIDDDGSLLLAPGTLERLGCAPGDLIGVRLVDGAPEVVVAAVADGAGELVAELRRRTLERLGPDEPTTITELVQGLVADVPGAFVDPVPPLGELFAEWALAVDADYVGAPGLDLAGWHRAQDIDFLSAEHELSTDEAAAVFGLVEAHGVVVDAAWSVIGAAGDRELDEAETREVMRTPAVRSIANAVAVGDGVRAAVRRLPEPAVAWAALEELTADRLDAAALEQLAGVLESVAERAPRPALRWLKARAVEEGGFGLEAEGLLGQAAALDPVWAPILLDQARFASDRGDAERALSLLHRLEADAAPDLLAVLKAHRPAPARMMSRNEPCWCGSGRKFKQCHLRQTESQSLADRADWLYAKAVAYLRAGHWLVHLRALADERSAEIVDDDLAVQAVDDGLLEDVLLFEGGALRPFVKSRAGLLPDDELELARSWLDTARSVYDVVAASPAGLVLRDVRTGAVQEVQPPRGRQRLRAGDLVSAHLLSVDSVVYAFGGLEPVHTEDRDELLDLLSDRPEPHEVIEICSRRFARTSSAPSR